MRYLDEFRDPVLAQGILRRIRQTVTRPWRLMEVCGGQTHSIVRNGIDQLLPDRIELIHGPGCPVCVTPLSTIDTALEIAGRDNVAFMTYADMLRVPGSSADLSSLKAMGADVRVVASPLEAISLAESLSEKEIVFLAIGFETTAPASAMAVLQAERRKLNNLSLLVAHVLIPPAMAALLQTEDNRVDAYLAAGHVCTITGMTPYENLVARYRVPVVVTGFEPVDLLAGILSAVRQLESGQCRVDNQYARAVSTEGNTSARAAVERVFEITDREWRGMGVIPSSGLQLRSEYSHFDAERRFGIERHETRSSSVCISGEILRGLRKPTACPEFGITCTPTTPLGATMVSSEGACAAYFKYHRTHVDDNSETAKP